MHPTLYLSSTLLFLPLLVLALPLPLCQDPDFPCEELEPASDWSLKVPAEGWSLNEGPLRREARPAELADADAAPVLSSTRRAIDWPFSNAGTEAPTALSHAFRALKPRWSTFLHNDLKVVKEPIEESPPNDATAADATLKEKRWTIPKGQWDILTVVDPDDADDGYGPDSDFVSDATTTELTGGS